MWSAQDISLPTFMVFQFFTRELSIVPDDRYNVSCLVVSQESIETGAILFWQIRLWNPLGIFRSLTTDQKQEFSFKEKENDGSLMTNLIVSVSIADKKSPGVIGGTFFVLSSLSKDQSRNQIPWRNTRSVFLWRLHSSPMRSLHEGSNRELYCVLQIHSRPQKVQCPPLLCEQKMGYPGHPYRHFVVSVYF